MSWTSGEQPHAPYGLPAVPPPLRLRTGLGGVLFVVLVAVALVLGAAVIALVLLAAGRPDAIVVGLVLAALPVGPLIACYLWLDRYEPEPTVFLALAFGWGALVATGGALVVQTLNQAVNGGGEVVSAVLVAPVTEEAGKGLFILLLLWLRRHVIDGLLDGLVYAGVVGIGFAFTENILYYAGAYTGGPGFGNGGADAATGLFVVRGIFSPFAHPLFTSMTGIGVGIAVSTRSRTLRFVAPVAGYVVAVCLHAAWNGSAFLNGGRGFVLTYLFAMVPGLLVAVGLAVWFRVREGRMLNRSLVDLAQRGYLHPRELAWLTGLPARRTARAQAARWGGPGAAEVMRDYQQQAIQLATLHNRVLRGTAPPDYAARGAAMAQRLAALRSHVAQPHRPSAGLAQQVWGGPSQQVGGWR
jgi:RsiW-degrading membrane proteinase PrsW (M82 family)